MHLLRHLTLAQEVYSFLSLSRAKVVHRWVPVCAGSVGHIFPGDSSGYVSQLPSFSSCRNGGVTKTALVLHYPESHIICKCSISVAPSSPCLGKCLERCFPIHQRIWSWAEHSGTAWDAHGAPCIHFSPELVPVFQFRV